MTSRCQLNLRFDGKEQLKQAAMERAKTLGMTLTDFVVSAIEDKLELQTEANDRMTSQRLADVLQSILQRLARLEKHQQPTDTSQIIDTTELIGEEGHQLIADRGKYAKLKEELANTTKALEDITQECEKAWQHKEEAQKLVMYYQKDVGILRHEIQQYQASRQTSQENLSIDADAIQILREALYFKGTAGKQIKQQIKKFFEAIGVSQEEPPIPRIWSKEATNFLDDLDRWEGAEVGGYDRT